ncbi:MAG: hypothetical protein Q8M31_00285 [Beijerinckiaceae bacterium]|nr:hypothetical protein [Beijerinckiaceae bacterium]
MPSSSRISEIEISRAVMMILADEPGGEATMGRLKELIPSYVTLSEADCVQSTTRPNEELWEQQVRNITSHWQTEGNIINDGYVERVEGGLRITDAGRHHIQP